MVQIAVLNICYTQVNLCIRPMAREDRFLKLFDSAFCILLMQEYNALTESCCFENFAHFQLEPSVQGSTPTSAAQTREQNVWGETAGQS